MAINSVDINECAINSLCGNRRLAIINTLQSYLPEDTHAPKGRAPRPKHQVITRTFEPDAHAEPSIVVPFTELPIISVSIEISNQTFSQAMDRSSASDDAVVFVRNLKSTAQDDIEVNISNFTILRGRE